MEGTVTTLIQIEIIFKILNDYDDFQKNDEKYYLNDGRSKL